MWVWVWGVVMGEKGSAHQSVRMFVRSRFRCAVSCVCCFEGGLSLCAHVDILMGHVDILMCARPRTHARTHTHTHTQDRIWRLLQGREILIVGHGLGGKRGKGRG